MMLTDNEIKMMLIEYLSDRRGEEVPRWHVLGDVARQIREDYGVHRKDADQGVLRASRALIREKVIVRKKKKRTLRISELAWTP